MMFITGLFHEEVQVVSTYAIRLHYSEGSLAAASFSVDAIGEQNDQPYRHSEDCAYFFLYKIEI